MLIHDGARWHGGIRHAGRWDLRAENGPADQPPDRLLAWAEERRIRRARAALPAELVDLGAPEEQLAVMSAADAFHALAHDLADKTGRDAEHTCPAAARVPVATAEGKREVLAAAAFDRETVERFAAACRLRGMALEGLAPFQGLALAEAAESAPPFKDLLILAGERDLFLAGLTAADRSLHWRHLPSGHTAAGRGPENNRRMTRALESFAFETIRLTAPEAALEALSAWIAPLLPGAAVQAVKLDERLPAWMERLEGAPPEPAEGRLGLAGLPPKPQDARRAGGLLCLGLILTTAALLTVQWRVLVWRKTHYTDLRAKIALLEAERGSAASALENAQRELSRVRAICSELENPPPKITGDFLPVLHALALSVTAYSHITSVVQEEGRVRVTGTTLWQGELGTFYERLQQALAPRGLRMTPQAVNDVPGSEERGFSLVIEKRSGT
jgi:hypothetical protein